MYLGAALGPAILASFTLTQDTPSMGAAFGFSLASGRFDAGLQRDLAVGAWNRSAILDDRAHVGGFVDLLCVADDHFVAVVDGLDAEGFLARFERFLLFDRVELQPLR